MATLYEDGRRKVDAGTTTLEEVLRVTSDEPTA
jgi:type II secretory ATPase GspE/PulE/Tfp pilus assembly ATPase PilB-like protein